MRCQGRSCFDFERVVYIHVDYVLVNFLSCPLSCFANKLLKWITVGERLMLIIYPSCL